MISYPAFFLGEPIKFLNLCQVYPPLIKDIATNTRYHQYVQTLVISQEDIWDMFKKRMEEDEEFTPPTPYELLMINTHHSPELEVIATEAFQFFTHESVRILTTEKIILFTDNIEEITDVSDLRILEEEHFFTFQNIIRSACGLKVIESPVEDEAPESLKLKRRREKETVFYKRKAQKMVLI